MRCKMYTCQQWLYKLYRIGIILIFIVDSDNQDLKKHNQMRTVAAKLNK